MRYVRSLENWPPDPGGAIAGKGTRFPSSDEAKVTKIEPRLKDNLVTFVGVFEGKEHTYDFEVPNQETATKLRDLIGKNLGRSVFEIGSLQFDDAA